MWNLENYEDVNARIKRFRAESPTGRLEAFMEDIDIKAGFILVKALAYRTYEDEKPAATDYAFEVRDASKINANWWVENAVTSAGVKIAHSRRRCCSSERRCGSAFSPTGVVS